MPAFLRVQRLLVAKNLALEKDFRRLDGFDVVLLDNIGYIQQDWETEVLSTSPAERDERRSVAITPNLVFSRWDETFKDPMTTTAAIDRLVHHSTILEVNGNSIRSEEERERTEREKLGEAPA